MRIKNTKLTYFIYQPYECAALEEYLEKMSEKGWLLQSVKGPLFKFKKIEPKKIRYSVDVLNKISIFDHKDSEVALEYREYCQASGWTYICQTGKIQIFYTEEDKKIIPIHTDEKEKFKAVFKASLYNVGSQFFLAIIFIFNMYMQLVLGNSAFLLASNLMIFSTTVMFFTVCLNSIQVINFFLWVIKARRELKENKFMPYNSYKQLRRKNLFIKFCIIIVIFISVKFTVFDTSWNKEFNAILVIIFIPIIISICSQWFINKKKYSKNTNMVISIGSTLVSIYLIVMLIGVIAFRSIIKADENQVTTDKSSLTLMDFGYKENIYENPHIDFNKSILAENKNYYYGEEDNKLNYEIFESQYPWVVKFHENRLISILIKYGSDIKEEKTNLPSNIRVYSEMYSEDKEKGFILISEDKVVEIRRKFSDINDEEFLNRVYKILFN